MRLEHSSLPRLLDAADGRIRDKTGSIVAQFRSFLEILVRRGNISREQLQHYIRIQIEEAVYFLFTWNQGSFQFEPDQRPEEGAMLVSIFFLQVFAFYGEQFAALGSLVFNLLVLSALNYMIAQQRLRQTAI